MAKPTLSDILTIPDPMLSDNFDFIIASVPQREGDNVRSVTGNTGASPTLLGSTATDVTNAAGNTSNGTIDIIRTLRLQCKTAIKPGSTLEQIEYQLFGHEVKFAGRLTYTHTMSVEYVENWKGSITRILEKWQEVGRYHKSQHGEFKNTYAVNAELVIYNQRGESSLTYKIYNIWPTEIPDLQFDGSAATPLSLSANFSYDFYELTNNVM
jgi:hypothetical protein